MARAYGFIACLVDDVWIHAFIDAVVPPEQQARAHQAADECTVDDAQTLDEFWAFTRRDGEQIAVIHFPDSALSEEELAEFMRKVRAVSESIQIAAFHRKRDGLQMLRELGAKLAQIVKERL